MAADDRPDVGAGAHLPKLRPGTQPPPPSWLPRQRRGTTPQMIGRYPDFDVLEAVNTWDEATKKVVLARLEPPGPLRFFTAAEEPTLVAFCDVVLAQDAEPRVPVAAMVDAKMADGKLDGYRYADMPEDPETWRRVARNLDATAAQRGAEGGFADAPEETQLEIVAAFSKGELEWEDLPVKRAFAVVTRTILSEFYSHPWAWNEIGFGGPAYPRGYSRFGSPHLDTAEREEWEGEQAFAVDPVRQ
jgi:Gluconate 2-dehydrogenase subunit 3